MQDIANIELPAPKLIPWNKGKMTGAKTPLRQKHVWAIRTKLQIDQRTRDLAMFNLAIDSKLRGCDVVALKVEDVATNGYSVDRATVRQKKTGRPVRFELTEQTRQAVDTYIRTAGKKPGEFLFTRPRSPDTPGTQINSLQIPFSSGPSFVYTLLFNANLVAGYCAIETQLAINNAVDPNYQINFSFSALNNELAQTPLLATLPLFASGLGGFGLLIPNL